MSIRRRLEVLEGRLPAKQPEPSDRTEVRTNMKAHFDRIAALRRSDDPADKAELEAFSVALERERARRRGGCLVDGRVPRY